ncbi:MAG TPA: hypothetical protein VF954_08290 [Acidimicrobiales bacterium]
MAIARIEELLNPAFVADLGGLSLSDVRARRDQCQVAADTLSYLRRLVQGRLDIVHADLERRAGGEQGDLADLVDSLPEILSDGIRGAGLGRLPTSFSPADADGWISEELDALADADRLGRLPELDEPAVRELANHLYELERKVSDQRHRLFDAANALQEEIVRRYKSGEANVDTLLR